MLGMEEEEGVYGVRSQIRLEKPKRKAPPTLRALAPHHYHSHRRLPPPLISTSFLVLVQVSPRLHPCLDAL